MLKGVSGVVRPGEMVAVLGPTGSGKTSLLNILSGRISTGQVYGDIRVNNQKRSTYWKNIVSCVEKDDHMYSRLTVKEVVMFTAQMRSVQGVTEEEKIEKVNNLLRVFGLDHIQNSRLGDFEKRGISGGERKRVSICGELVASPRILFMDEPTTGLDSSNAQTVCECLREVAQRDRISMLITIHQPKHNLLRLFNSIILLTEGRVIFSGSVDGALKSSFWILDLNVLHEPIQVTFTSTSCPSITNP